MVRKQPCHMPCNQEDKGHSLPMNAKVSSFKPVTTEVARAMIDELKLTNPVEPFQHPDYRLCYATHMHVLTHAPASLPEILQILSKFAGRHTVVTPHMRKCTIPKRARTELLSRRNKRLKHPEMR